MILTGRTKPWRGRRGGRPSTLDAVSHSRVLKGRHRRVLLSGVTARVALILAVGAGASQIKGSTGRRRRTLGLTSSWAIGGRGREQDKVRLWYACEAVWRCLRRRTRGWGLGKPCLVVIRFERLKVVWGNGCWRARTGTSSGRIQRSRGSLRGKKGKGWSGVGKREAGGIYLVCGRDRKLEVGPI